MRSSGDISKSLMAGQKSEEAKSEKKPGWGARFLNYFANHPYASSTFNVDTGVTEFISTTFFLNAAITDAAGAVCSLAGWSVPYIFEPLILDLSVGGAAITFLPGLGAAYVTYRVHAAENKCIDSTRSHSRSDKSSEASVSVHTDEDIVSDESVDIEACENPELVQIEKLDNARRRFTVIHYATDIAKSMGTYLLPIRIAESLFLSKVSTVKNVARGIYYPLLTVWGLYANGKELSNSITSLQQEADQEATPAARK